MIALVCVLSFAGLLLFSNHENFENNNPELSTLVDIYHAIQLENCDSRKKELENLFADKLSENSLDSLINIIGLFSDSTYYQQVLDTIEIRALQEGPIAISKVYKTGLDDLWGDVVEEEIINHIDRIPIEVHQKILPYFSNTELEERIRQTFISRVEYFLQDERYCLMDSLFSDVNQTFAEQVEQDINSIYEEFLGWKDDHGKSVSSWFKNLVGNAIDWNNIKNNVLKTKAETNRIFLEIWNNKMNSEKYILPFKHIIDNRLLSYNENVNHYLGAIHFEQSDFQISSMSAILPNIEVMRDAVNQKTKIFYKNATFTSIDLVTSGWYGVAAFAGDIGTDYLEEFKDPKSYFIEREKLQVYNQYTIKLAQIDSALQERDSIIVERIKISQ